MLSLGSSRKLLLVFLLFLSFRLAFLPKLFHMTPKLFEVEKDHVRVNHRRLLSKRNPLDFIHDIFQGLFERPALDIENCVDVLVLPIKDATDLESVLVVLAQVRIFRRGFEDIVVPVTIPYSVDADEVNFGAPIIVSVRQEWSALKDRETRSGT